MMARPMRRPGTWIALLVGVGALALAVWFLVRPEDEEAAVPPPPFRVPVTLCHVEPGDLRPRAQLTGTVRAANRADLAFEVDGTVRELLAEEAQAVERGAVLARLDRVDEELALASAQAALELAQREQALLVAGEREEEKRRLAAVVESARAEEELARNEVGRGERLLESRVLSESENDRRVSVLRVAETRRIAAEEDLARAEAGTRPEDLAIAAARVDEARARLATASHALEKTELRAPWSGRVLERFVSTGDYVDSGAPVYELIDLDHLEIHLDVPARLSGRVGAATLARVRTGGTGFETELDAVLPAADESARSFRAILRLGPDDGAIPELRPGQFLDIELLLEPLTGALLASSDAVVAGPEGRYVVRAVPAPPGEPGAPDGGLVAEIVPVDVLAEEGGRSALAARGDARPLAAGDALVLVGADSAFPGAALMVREPQAASPGVPGAEDGAR
jgi:RND family efflux transporter MFP subunit